jgi:hypothetical protein
VDRRWIRDRANGVPYLTPEIQLFYTANGLRPKDRTDFLAVLPFLTRDQRRWLTEALSRAYGTRQWRDHLTG